MRVNFIQIIRRSGKPIKFTAGNIFPMTIETFTSVSILFFFLDENNFQKEIFFICRQKKL